MKITEQKLKIKAFLNFYCFQCWGGQSKRFLSTSCYARTLLHIGSPTKFVIRIWKLKKIINKDSKQKEVKEKVIERFVKVCLKYFR
jgi:hypothetical protein